MLTILILVVLPILGIYFLRSFNSPERFIPWIGILLLFSGVPAIPFPVHVLPVPGTLITLCLSIVAASQGVYSFRRCGY